MTVALENLLGPGEIRSLAERLGLRPTKTLGQNFVHDHNTVRKIVTDSNIGPHDDVLEVGPGLGSLTLGLLQVAHTVTAVEIDPRLADALPGTVGAHLPALADRLTVVAADALALTPGMLRGHMRAADGGGGVTLAGAGSAGASGMPTALVANLPYNVAVPILLHLLAELPSVVSVLVMVQSEVADRLVAPPGSRTYGIPSVKCAWYGTARRVGSVPRSVFWPVPKVDSALVSVRRHDADRAGAGSFGPGAGAGAGSEADRQAVFAAIDAAFAQRRKTLRAALSRWAGSAALAEQCCRAAGIDPGARGERLGVEGFVALAAHRRAPAPAPAPAEPRATEGSAAEPRNAERRNAASRGAGARNLAPGQPGRQSSSNDQ